MELSASTGAARLGRSLAVRLGRFVDPLRDPSFRRLAVGRSVSVLGDWLLIAGLVGWVYGRTGSTGHVAVLMIVRLLPPVAGGVVAGALADRLPRQQLLVAAELVCGVAVTGALVGVLHGSEAIVFACVALCAFVAPLGSVSMNAIVPDVLPEARRTPGNAMLQLGQEIAMATGALAAGITLSSGTAAGALGLDLASYVVAAVLFARIRVTVSSTRRSASSSGARFAVRHIFGNPSLRAVALAFPLVTLATGLTNATLPRDLTDLGLGAGGYGFGLATLALGSAVGEIGIGASGSRLGARTLAVGDCGLVRAVCRAGIRIDRLRGDRGTRDHRPRAGRIRGRVDDRRAAGGCAGVPRPCVRPRVDLHSDDDGECRRARPAREPPRASAQRDPRRDGGHGRRRSRRRRLAPLGAAPAPRAALGRVT